MHNHWLWQHLWKSAHEAGGWAVNLSWLGLLLWRMSILEPHFRSKLLYHFLWHNCKFAWYLTHNESYAYSLQKLFLTGQSFLTKLFLFPNLYLLYILNLGSWSRSYTQKDKHSGPKVFLHSVCRMVALVPIWSLKWILCNSHVAANILLHKSIFPVLLKN